MKTNTLISFLLLSVLSFTACTPRDVKVVDANTRMKINAKKGKGGGANQKKVSPQEFALSNYSLSAFLAEKQIEAIEFVKLATGSADAKKTQYIVSPAEDADGGVKSLKIFTNKEELQYTTEAGSWIAKANKYLAVTYALKDGVIDSLSVQGSDLKSSVDSSDKDQTFVKLSESSYELKATTAKDNAQALEINVKIDGEIDGAKGGATASNKVGVKLQIIVDKASLATAEVKILKVIAAMTYPGPKGKTYNSNFEGGSLTLKVDGLCNALSGNVKASAGPKNSYIVGFDSDHISVVGKNWENALATCGKRPTVDLGRLQVY